MNVLLIDDHAIVSDGIEALLATSGSLKVIAKCNRAEFGLAYLKKEPIDLLITDYSMPDMNGLQLVKAVRSIQPELKIIVLSMHDEPALVQEIIGEGIDGYILKKYSHDELLQAIQIISKGGQFWSCEISKILVSKLTKPDAITLTEREIEVLKLLINEYTSKEIAEQLFISERTVETHRKNLMRKTNSANAVGLIKYAFANRYI